MIASLLAAVITANSTAYCLQGTMADGTGVRSGSVASNWHPLGTRIRLLSTTFAGQRKFVVRDRIGYGTELDFWTPSCSFALDVWGRRTVTYKIGWGPLKVKRGKVIRKIEGFGQGSAYYGEVARWR